MSRIGKFFIICGIVCVVGIGLTAAGFAMGGVEDMDKVSESHEWFQAGSGNSQSDVIEPGDYDSIEAEGTMDILVIGSEFERELEELLEDADIGFLDEAYNGIYGEEMAGKVAVVWEQGIIEPDIKVEKGVLEINSNYEPPQGEVNLSGADRVPDVIVFCENADLDRLQISNENGDTAICGVLCADLKIDSKNGDVAFGTQHVQKEFEVSLQTDFGDICVNDADLEQKDYTSKGGPNKLTLKTETGDINVNFGEE